MATSTQPVEQRTDLLKHAQELYDRHRFLDAYTFTEKFWSSSTDVSTLTAEELVFAGRLATRLGGRRVSRWLMRKAFEREPANPTVRYFTRFVRMVDTHLLDDLRTFNDAPDLGGDNADLRGSWYAAHAYTWASLRDFDRAYECLAEAHRIRPDSAYILSCESDVYGFADRWSDALKAAERSCELEPGAPYSAYSLGNSLLHLGRIDESAARLSAISETSQSCEVVMNACWHLCALAETQDGALKRTTLDKARLFAKLLPALSPLADRETNIGFARINLDIAQQADDYEEMEHCAAEAKMPYFRQLLVNLRKNVEGSRVRLTGHHVIQKYAACVPTSVSVVLSAYGTSATPEEIASEITFEGTHEFAAADWLRARGWHVRFFAVEAETAVKLVKARIAFTLSWDSDESGHAVAVVGHDQRAEVLLVQDPQSFRGVEYLLSIFERNRSPLGMKGMAIVPKERAEELGALLPAESAVMEAAQDHVRASLTQGSSAGVPVVEAIAQKFPDHPGVQYLRALQDLEEGHVGNALVRLQELLKQFPESPAVRGRLMSACEALGNTALLRDMLKDIVERGVLPGLESQQDWVHPPDRYVFVYADLLRLSSETSRQGESMLRSLVRRQPVSAGGWHNLGDLLWQKPDREGALLCYRLASSLAIADEHYARAYSDAMIAARHESEGLAWLESRARKFGDSPRAVATWVTWISALEDAGHPERALAACQEALEKHKGLSELLGFAVPFFARMGQWELAEAQLDVLRAANRPADLYSASLHFFRMRGDLAQAIENAEKLISEQPRNFVARHALLDLIALRDGPPATVRLSGEWLRDHQENEQFEYAYCSQLQRAAIDKRLRYGVLLRRLKRNPNDAWAWREATLVNLIQFNMADERRRQRLRPRIEQLLRECDRTSAESSSTLHVHALWHQWCARWADAVATSVRTVRLEPGFAYGYEHAWACSSRLSSEERKSMWAELEPILVASSGRLSIAREVMSLQAGRLGVAAAEKAVAGWREARPDDPDVIEAAAALLVEHGHGRSDCLRAIEMLKPAVERYPYHSRLRFLLANAYQGAGQHKEAEAVLVEIARRHPDDAYATVNMAHIRQRRGDAEGAYKILDERLAREQRNRDVLEARARILIENHRFDDAVALVEQGLERMPDDIDWRRRSIGLLSELGANDKAVQAAREGVKQYPRGAYLWLMLGQRLNRSREYAEVGEIEACLRRSLDFNRAYFDAADLLSVYLCEQRRYDDAAKVISEIETRMSEPSPARARLAGIRRVKGERKEALADLSKVVEDDPSHAWSWAVLMEWLEEDKAWDEAKKLLSEIPPPMYTTTSFRLERLSLLEKAGLDRKELDAEWQQLLDDFPEDISLYARRFDSLADEQRFEEAESVLDRILAFDPDNVFLMARKVDALAHAKKQAEAVQLATQVCFTPVGNSTWPVDRVWEVAEKTGFSIDLYKAARQQLSSSARAAHQTVTRMARHAMAVETRRTKQSRLSNWRPPEGAREVLGMMDLLPSAGADGSRARAELYSVLCDYGYGRLIYQRFTARADTSIGIDEWSQVGRALVSAHMYKEGREFLSKWRERPGGGMWVVANYTLCLSRFRREQLEELLRTCREALAGLPHDHCARYLAYIQAETCALLGDREGLLQTWNNYPNYFDGECYSNEYFKAEHRHLLADIPIAVRYLQHGDSGLYRRAVWGLRRKHLFPMPAPNSASEQQESTGTGIPWWLWWVIWIALMGLINSRNSQ